MTKKIIISTLVSTIILFGWNGLVQMFPWGVPSAQTITTQSVKKTESFQTPNLIELPANTFTTEKFDNQMADKISTLTTDKTFSWIITKPITYYNMGAYFTKEAITQFLVALFISILLSLTVKESLKRRLSFSLLAGLMAVTAIYVQMMNWWGLPARYALGAGFNIIIGWLIVSFISAKYIIKFSK
jgi:hypothetical protein